MALSRELYVPDGFQPNPGYKEPENAPGVVIAATNSILDLYFNGSLYDTSHAREFLSRSTANFIREARVGFFAVFDKTPKISKRDLKSILYQSQEIPLNPDAESIEAFGDAAVVFSAMPRVFSDPRLGALNSFSTRGILAVPETSLEFMERINELGREVDKIVHGETTPDAIVEAAPPLIRTYGFFKTGSELPIKVPETDRDLDEYERSAFDKLLGDLVIEL